MNNLSAKQSFSPELGEIDFSKIFNQLWKSKWLILLVVVFTLALGMFYLSRQVPQYQSEILLQIESRGNSGLAGHLSEQLSTGYSRKDPVAIQIALIKSRFILSPVVKSLGLDIKVQPKQSKAINFFFPSQAHIKVKQFAVPQSAINKPFSLQFDNKNHFSLYSPTGSFLFRGEVGKLVTNQDKTIRLWVDSFNAPKNTTFELKKISRSQAVKSLQHGLKVIDLEGAEWKQTGVLELTLTTPDPVMTMRVLNEIAKTVQEKDIQKNAVEASKTLEFLYQQLPITKHELEQSETQLNRYRAKSGKIDIKLQSQSLLTQLSDVDKELSKLQMNKMEMLQRYTLEHPFIITLNTQIQQFKAQRGKLEILLKKLPSSDQIAVNLMRDVEVKNTLYLVLLNKIQELQVAKAGIVSDVRILSLAKLSNDPIPFKKLAVYLASILLGFLISCIILYTGNLIYSHVDDPLWSERHFDILNVAIIPYSKKQAISSQLLKSRNSKHLSLLAHDDPRGFAIESLRSLRTSLQVKLRAAPNNIVAILGASPNVGKSFVSANLAYLLAAGGKRVLLVDIDLRRGTLHKYFNLMPSPGFADVLRGNKEIHDVLHESAYKNLTILPRGTYPSDPSELLMSDQFKETLHTLSSQYDIVIVDTPPVLLVTDAAVIGMHAGTNYLLVGANAHQPNEIEMSIKRLANAGVAVNGTIFNFNTKKSNNQSYYKYDSYYYDDEIIK